MKNHFPRLLSLLLALLLLLPLQANAAEEGLIGGEGSGIVNFLLIGRDTQEGKHGRSDSMILCTLNKAENKITLTSFLRDLYLPIPGHRSNRINAAYAFGGAPLLKETLESNFRLHIDGCIQADFSQFAQIIDLLGGVDITLRSDEAAHIARETGTILSEGTHTLNGVQALSYSRIRKLDKQGDFGRTDRQRKVLQSVADRVRSAPLPTLLSLVRRMIPMISTDLAAHDILSYAITYAPLLTGGTITSQHIPAPEDCRYETIQGMSVLTADMSALRQTLKDTLLPH